jgi:hypothetical protein
MYVSKSKSISQLTYIDGRKQRAWPNYQYPLNDSVVPVMDVYVLLGKQIYHGNLTTTHIISLTKAENYIAHLYRNLVWQKTNDNNLNM